MKVSPSVAKAQAMPIHHQRVEWADREVGMTGTEAAVSWVSHRSTQATKVFKGRALQRMVGVEQIPLRSRNRFRARGRRAYGWTQLSCRSRDLAANGGYAANLAM